MLNEDQKRLKREILEAKEEMIATANDYHELLNKCEHSIVKRNESAICEVCNKNFGWWCPDSPGHMCDYSDGSDMNFSENCLFCGQPDERK